MPLLAKGEWKDVISSRVHADHLVHLRMQSVRNHRPRINYKYYRSTKAGQENGAGQDAGVELCSEDCRLQLHRGHAYS